MWMPRWVWPRSGLFGLLTLVPAGAALDLAAQGAPYGIDQRPQPRGTALDTLLPSVVGTFRRAAFAPRTPVPVTEEMVVRYGAGADSVSVAFRIPGRPEDAQAAVRTARDRAKARRIDVSHAAYVMSHDPSWFQTERLMAWSRGGYSFSAEAATREVLDRFMRAFPY